MNYSENLLEFNSLLETNIPEAIELRIHQLEEESQSYLISIGIAQVASGGLLALSLPLSTTPFVPVLALLGAGAFAYTTFRDFFTTGKLLAAPKWRISVTQQMQHLQAIQAKKMYGETIEVAQDHDHEVTACLSKMETIEYRLLTLYPSLLTQALEVIPPQSRSGKYRALISQHRRGEFPSRQQLELINQSIEQNQKAGLQTPISTPNPSITTPTPPPEPPSVNRENLEKRPNPRTPEGILRMEKESGVDVSLNSSADLGSEILPTLPTELEILQQSTITQSTAQTELISTTDKPGEGEPLKDIPERPNTPTLPQLPDRGQDEEDHRNEGKELEVELEILEEEEEDDLIDVATLLNLPQADEGDDEPAMVPRYLQAFVQSDDFPEEDLALELAKTTVDVRNAGATLIACPKGTGKSNLLRAAMTYANELHQGNIDFLIFAGKDDETYCGLENEPSIYLESGDIQHAPEVVRRMSEYQSRLKKFCGRPTIFVDDEYNNTLAAADMYDKLNGTKPRYADLTTGLTYERITKGRSKLVCDWITSHEADVRAIKFSLSLQQSLNFAVLGRGNKMAAINAALTGRRPIVDDEQIREQLRAKFTNYRQNNPADFDTVIALTNIGGDWRLIRLPKYPDVQPKIVLHDERKEQSSEEQPQVSFPCEESSNTSDLTLNTSEDSPTDLEAPEDDFQPIVEHYRKKKAPVTASDLIASSRYLRKKYKNTEAVNQLLLQAEELGIGFTRSTGKVLEFFVV